jgi:hypothetical protein
MSDCAKEVISYSLIKIDVEETGSKICEDELKMKIKLTVLFFFI